MKLNLVTVYDNQQCEFSLLEVVEKKRNLYAGGERFRRSNFPEEGRPVVLFGRLVGRGGVRSPPGSQQTEHRTPRRPPFLPPPPHPLSLSSKTAAAAAATALLPPLSMSLHHCCATSAAAIPAMATATGSGNLSSTAAAPPLRFLGPAQGQLRLPPAACRRRLLLRCSASGGGGGDGSDPVLEEQGRRRAELAARIASGEFTAQGPGLALPVPSPPFSRVSCVAPVVI